MKKIFILSLFSFFLCGCSVEYTVEINKTFIEDNFKIIYKDSDTKNKDNDRELMGNRLISLIEYDVYPLFDDYSVKYNKELKKDNENNILNLNFKYNTSQYSSANVIKSCFRNKDININENNFNINLDGYFYCLYNNEEIVINVMTDYNVTYNNANYVDGGKYTWIINKNNYKNVNISLIADSTDSVNNDNIIDSIIDNINEYEDEEVTSSLKSVFIIFCGIFLLGLIFVFIKFKNSNKK